MTTATVARNHGVMGSTTEPAPLLLTPQEAANALRISPRKLWGLMDEGTIPHVRVGKLVRYDPADLRAWIEDSKERCRRHPPEGA